MTEIQSFIPEGRPTNTCKVTSSQFPPRSWHLALKAHERGGEAGAPGRWPSGWAQGQLCPWGQGSCQRPGTGLTLGPHPCVVCPESPPQWPATWTWPSTPWTSRSARCIWRAVSATQAGMGSTRADAWLLRALCWGRAEDSVCQGLCPSLAQGQGGIWDGASMEQEAWAGSEEAVRPERPGPPPMDSRASEPGQGMYLHHWATAAASAGHLAMVTCTLASSSGPVHLPEASLLLASLLFRAPRMGRVLLRRAAGG